MSGKNTLTLKSDAYTLSKRQLCVAFFRMQSVILVAIAAVIVLYGSYSYAASAPPFPTVFPVNGPTAACMANPSGVNCASKLSTYYELTDAGIKQMYEQSVEEPCFARGLSFGCSYNSYFKQQIRMNIRYCLGVPLPIPWTNACWTKVMGIPMPSNKFWNGSHDCWKLLCNGGVGGEMSGYKELQNGECSFIKGVRFCARLANGGQAYGNRTNDDPDYRAVGSPYSSTPQDFTLDNGKVITIVNDVSTRVDPITNHTATIGYSHVTQYNGGPNWSDLETDSGMTGGNKGTVYVNPPDAVVIEGRAVDGKTPIQLIKTGTGIYQILSPRVQLCAFEDPIDINDLDGNHQFMHFMTPGIDFEENPLVGYAIMLGVAYAVLPFAAPSLLLAASVLVIIAAIQTNINYVVYQNEGCVDVPLGPYPPPYPVALSTPFPIATVQKICTSTQTEATADCVMPKVAGQYDTFTVPRIRVGFPAITPLCDSSTNQVATSYAPCVNVSGNQVTSSNMDNIKDQFIACDTTNGTGICSTTRPSNIRPAYELETSNPDSYKLTGVMTGDYTDLSFNFTQDPVLKDYPSGTNTVTTLQDPRSGTTTYANRTFFNCLSEEGDKMCGYELLKTDMSNPTHAGVGNVPYPCQYITDPLSVLPLGCLDRQPLPPITVVTTPNVPNPTYHYVVDGVTDTKQYLTASFATCTTEAARAAQSPNCSSHTDPLLQVSLAGQSMIFSVKTPDFITQITSSTASNWSVNPIHNDPIVNEQTAQNYPDGGYSSCRYFYGREFCAAVTDENGGADPVQYVTQKDAAGNTVYQSTTQADGSVTQEVVYQTDSNGNPIYESGILYDSSGYLYGGKKICLGLPDAGIIVLAKKRTGMGYPADVSTAAADVLSSNYHQGDVINYAGRIPVTGDATNTVMNTDTEGTRAQTTTEQGACVDVPPPIPCPSITYHDDPSSNGVETTGAAGETTNTRADGNANWSGVMPTISSDATGTIVQGTCRPGWAGAPTRQCTVRVDVNGQNFGEWGPVSNGCVLRVCPAQSDMDDGSYDCDWSQTTVFHQDKDTCSKPDGWGGTMNHNRALCCTDDPWPSTATAAQKLQGIWRGQDNDPNNPYPDADTPPTKCNWTTPTAPYLEH